MQVFTELCKQGLKKKLQSLIEIIELSLINRKIETENVRFLNRVEMMYY